MNEAPPAPAPRPKVAGASLARMEDPEGGDFIRSAITLAWFARSSISTIERAVEARDKSASSLNPNMKSAANVLAGIAGLMEQMGYRHEADACGAASDAAMASFFHGEVAQAASRRLAAAGASSDAQWNLYERLHYRAMVIWGKSAEGAREETHRALAALCDRFPDSFSKIDEEA